MAELVINLWVFIGMMLLMSVACINMVNVKGDGRNSGAGYRTKRSNSSKEAWNLGNKTFGYCSLSIPILEGILIYIEYKLLIPKGIIQSKEIIIPNLIVMVIAIVICCLITESKLKKSFE
ncbi:MAG: SdpI/YfhL protein family [Anaerocolumna sp.]|nr:SdpI/YfhL protein family [Anaerocolumna sp.]